MKCVILFIYSVFQVQYHVENSHHLVMFTHFFHIRDPNAVWAPGQKNKIKWLQGTPRQRYKGSKSYYFRAYLLNLTKHIKKTYIYAWSSAKMMVVCFTVKYFRPCNISSEYIHNLNNVRSVIWHFLCWRDRSLETSVESFPYLAHEQNICLTLSKINGAYLWKCCLK